LSDFSLLAATGNPRGRFVFSASVHPGVFDMSDYETTQKFSAAGLPGIKTGNPLTRVPIPARLILKPDPPAQTS
jgi:hypothetical protein